MEYRELSKSERLKFDDDLPELSIGAFEDDVLIAVCGITPVLHLDPVWVRPDKRRQGMVGRLWQAVSDNLRGKGVSVVTTGFIPGEPDEETAKVVVKICEDLGGVEIKGTFWGLKVLGEKK